MNDRRIARIQELIKARIAEVVSHELSDPDIGMVTITRVQVDREMMACKVFWSVLGGEGAQKKTAAVLNKAKGFVRKEVASVLSTRSVPQVQFRFDESIAGAMRMEGILKQLRDDREAGEPPVEGSPDSTPAPDGTPADSTGIANTGADRPDPKAE